MQRPFKRVLSPGLIQGRSSARDVDEEIAGIGLTTAMFALVDHVLLRPLPFAEPEGLVSLSSALGATSMKLIALVVSGASVLIAAGVALGVGGALALTRTLESQLVEVSKTDPLAIVTGVVVIGVTALLAALIPAIRASAPDPARVLRSD